MYTKTVLTVFGTRPEAIKMAPVIKELEKNSMFNSIVCVTAQHRQMLDQVLDLFNIKPDFDLNVMKENQDLWQLTSSVLLQMKDVFEKVRPDLVLVHGDTTTTMATALSAFYAKVPIGHVEAGLRTFDKNYPFPEEINRVITDNISSFYFAPTLLNKENLEKTGINKNVYVTGNTVIDALFYTLENKKTSCNFNLNSDLKTILLTSHRRENLGNAQVEICNAMKDIVSRNDDVQVVFPVHLNPKVQETVFGILDNIERVSLIEPLDYAPFCQLMNESDLILSDSGGVQEEAPSLNKKVFVLRDKTERPEALKTGFVELLGTNKNDIIKRVQEFLDNKEHLEKLEKNPYGDGSAAKKIVKIIKENL